MIQIQNLTFGYKSSKENVLENVNLQLNPGSIVGLLGKNGTGKTTLLNLITGQLFAKQGVISIDDENVKTMRNCISSQRNLLCLTSLLKTSSSSTVLSTRIIVRR